MQIMSIMHLHTFLKNDLPNPKEKSILGNDKTHILEILIWTTPSAMLLNAVNVSLTVCFEKVGYMHNKMKNSPFGKVL